MKLKLLFLFVLLISIVGIVYSLSFQKHVELEHSHFQGMSKLEKVHEIAHDAQVPENKNVNIYLETHEVLYTNEENKSYVYWTFNKTVPGPFLRVRQGDEVSVTIKNPQSSSFVHSIDLHGVTGHMGGGELTQVLPGEEKSFTFNASKPGLYVYHCATPNVAHHIANGMYGMILVEPKEGLREVDREFYLMQGELYWREEQENLNILDSQRVSDERPNQIVFNGRVNALTGKNSLQVRNNETTRLFVGNGGISKISSFHLIGEIFDRVYPEAATNMYFENVQTTLIPAGGASMIEFETDVVGEYIFVDHALARLEKGAAGSIKVIGK